MEKIREESGLHSSLQFFFDRTIDSLDHILFVSGRVGLKMEPSKIVMRYADGRVLKGYTKDFFPEKPTFYLYEKHPKFSDEPKQVSVKDLKGIFFVRDFLGNPQKREPKKIPDGLKVSGRKVEVTFKDKEVMVGSILDYNPERAGFFLFPTNPHSNNITVFVVSQAVLSVRFL